MLIICGSRLSFAASSIDIRGEYENWETDLGGSSNSPMFGLGLTADLDKNWLFSGGVSLGKFSLANETIDLNRTDIDIGVARTILQRLNIFTGYRLSSLNVNNKLDATANFEEFTHGLGLGVGSHVQLLQNLYSYGRLSFGALYSVSQSDVQQNFSGFGYSSGVEAGLVYPFNPKTILNINAKYQKNVINYKKSDGTWSHSYFRIGLSVSRQF